MNGLTTTKGNLLEREYIKRIERLAEFDDARANELRSLRQWLEYREMYLTPVRQEESFAIIEMASDDVRYEIGKPIKRRLKRLESGLLERVSAETVDAVFKHTRQREQMILNRLWEAGYYITYFDRVTGEPSDSDENLLWLVKSGAPLPPPSYFEIELYNPDKDIELKSRPFKAIDHFAPSAALFRMFSSSIPIFVDRASRDRRNWDLSGEGKFFPEFTDPGSPGLSLVYGKSFIEIVDSVGAIKLASDKLEGLDDRTSDVWRVILWKAAEAGIINDGLYKNIIIDARETARLLGYKPHKNGGMKQEHIIQVNEALRHLERMVITISPEFEHALQAIGDGKNTSRKSVRLSRIREEKLISVMARDLKRGASAQSYHAIWEVALGGWSRLISRSYAPMFKALVELPARAGVGRWSKRIGTELVFLYRQDAKSRSRVKRIKCLSLLSRAGLMSEIEEMRLRNHGPRARRYTEEALDKLVGIGVIKHWQMAPESEARIEAGSGTPGNFDTWLHAILEIAVPDEINNLLETVVLKSKKK